MRDSELGQKHVLPSEFGHDEAAIRVALVDSLAVLDDISNLHSALPLTGSKLSVSLVILQSPLSVAYAAKFVDIRVSRRARPKQATRESTYLGDEGRQTGGRYPSQSASRTLTFVNTLWERLQSVVTKAIR